MAKKKHERNNDGNIHPTRIFKNPEQLYQAFEEYKKDLEKRSKDWLKIQYVGKDGDRVADPQKLPMTMEGFKIFCKKNYGCVKQYLENKDGYYEDFVEICSYIAMEVRENQITGGLLGFYNPSITQRLNGLTEKVQNEIATAGNLVINIEKA